MKNEINKITQVRNGLLKPIPITDTNLPKWSGINGTDIVINKSNLIKTKIKIKRRNLFLK